MDKKEKNIIKYYLKIKENLNKKDINFKYLKKLNLLFSQINFNSDLNHINREQIIYIKNFCDTLMDEFISSSLNFKINKVSNKIFELINEGDISSISEVDNNDYKIFNEEGLTPLHKCINLGDTTILKELLKKGENIDIVNRNGNTLLEYACLQKDPNLISFIISHGGDMKKHLFFRENFKLKMKVNDIDTAILLKFCILKGESDSNSLDFLFDFIDSDFEVGLSNIRFKLFKNFLEQVLNKLSDESKKSIIDIWKEELNFELRNNLGCPKNYLEILLFNLIPFIDYPFNVSNRNIITNELIYSIKNIFVKNNSINDFNFNVNLINYVWNEYQNILPLDYIGIILNNILTNLKLNFN